MAPACWGHCYQFQFTQRKGLTWSHYLRLVQCGRAEEKTKLSVTKVKRSAKLLRYTHVTLAISCSQVLARSIEDLASGITACPLCILTQAVSMLRALHTTRGWEELLCLSSSSP